MKWLKLITVVGLVTVAQFATKVAAKEVDQTLSVEPGVQVFVDNMRGHVKVLGWGQSSASISGTIDEEATDFIFEKRGNALIVEVKMPRNKRYYNDNGSDLVLRIPYESMVDVSGISSDFTVKDIRQGTRVTTISGDIDANSLDQNVRLKTTSGDVSGRKLNGDVELVSVSGDVNDADGDQQRGVFQSTSGDVAVVTNASEVRAESISGDVNLTTERANDVTATSVSGDVSVRVELNDNGRLRGNTVSGDMAITFKGTPNFRLDAEASASGDITNRLTDDEPRRPKYGPGASLTMTVGNGSGNVKLNSVSGNIVIRN
ncbi:hypothetical protein CWE22_00345 [Pseudidiomarina aestuarii]|uniref:DUF4097 domain-containing protein n=1 Tax=Pseudidiomarina aestuarii TaxID=624146 RepID=A0A7Z6ZT05_9GAMM|nr:DUF4097 family beta strand repeat-containing protein [Pseudidiomarina aestuarii]RUO40697.1 hypothetical protein CWE22_00345 [Pseudidiomarina aestuarii]